MKTKSTALTYLNALHEVYNSSELAEDSRIPAFLQQFHDLSISTDLIPVLFAIDYTKRNYLFWSDKIELLSGHKAVESLEGGLDMTLHLLEKDFFKTFNERLFPITLNFLKETPQTEHQNYLFTFNHRMKNKAGKWVDIYQRCIYLTAKETGIPLYCIGIGIDITPFKKDNTMVHTIEKKDSETGCFAVLDTSYFHPFEEETILSKQERNVLKYMADGLSSKMIGQKLHLSENTISNHRQSMLRKTNTKNVAHLVAFALKNGLI